MNKYELKYQLEQMTSTVDRLTDVCGKQCEHISDLWAEIHLKNNRYNEVLDDLKKTRRELLHVRWKEKKERDEKKEVTDAQLEKIFGEHSEN